MYNYMVAIQLISENRESQDDRAVFSLYYCISCWRQTFGSRYQDQRIFNPCPAEPRYTLFLQTMFRWTRVNFYFTDNIGVVFVDSIDL